VLLNAEGTEEIRIVRKLSGRLHAASMKPSWHQLSCFGILALILTMMSVEWLRVAPVPPWLSEDFRSIRDEVISLLLQKKPQAVLLGGLFLYHLCLLWWKQIMQNKGQSPWWKALSPIDWCRFVLAAWMIGRWVADWSFSPVIGNRELFLFGIEQSTNPLVLLCGIVLSQVIEIVLLYQPLRRDRLVDASSFAIVLFLAATSLFQNNSAYKFYYRGESRLTGLWVNPNTYGLLMGTGLLLAIAHGIKYTFQVESQLPGNHVPGVKFKHHESSFAPESQRAILLKILIFVASTLLLLGLVRSYSRGAWLATLGGAANLYCAYAQKSQVSPNSHRRGAFIIFSSIWNLRWILLISTCAAGALLLPHLSHSDHVLAKRITSALNLNDFSSQNRLVAIEGALQIIANNPELGVGWPGAATQFAEFYAPAALIDPWSIILNDYLTLGMSLGLPGLVAFIALIWVSWNQTDSRGDFHPVGSASWNRVACRSAVLVMLIGCWFDGVLFRLVLAVPLFLFLGLLAKPILCPTGKGSNKPNYEKSASDQIER
jgi:hypothetical protein